MDFIINSIITLSLMILGIMVVIVFFRIVILAFKRSEDRTIRDNNNV